MNGEIKLTNKEKTVIAYSLCGLSSTEISVETGIPHDDIKRFLEEWIPILDFYYDGNDVPHIRNQGGYVEI